MKKLSPSPKPEGKPARRADRACIAHFWEEKLDLPGEALGEPRLSIWGDRRALLENCGGILHWSPELLAVRWGGGSLLLYGRQLQILSMDGSALLLSGILERTEWRE